MPAGTGLGGIDSPLTDDGEEMPPVAGDVTGSDAGDSFGTPIETDDTTPAPPQENDTDGSDTSSDSNSTPASTDPSAPTTPRLARAISGHSELSP